MIVGPLAMKNAVSTATTSRSATRWPAAGGALPLKKIRCGSVESQCWTPPPRSSARSRRGPSPEPWWAAKARRADALAETERSSRSPNTSAPATPTAAISAATTSTIATARPSARANSACNGTLSHATKPENRTMPMMSSRGSAAAANAIDAPRNRAAPTTGPSGTRRPRSDAPESETGESETGESETDDSDAPESDAGGSGSGGSRSDTLESCPFTPARTRIRTDRSSSRRPTGPARSFR